MENEVLNINIQEIKVLPGIVEFNEYEALKAQALELAANIQAVEVNDETVKASKKLLAAVNKRVKEMEDKRIAIKKEMLEPYNTFEQQVKEIVTIVKDADNIVRDQIKELEEKEREEKRDAIHEIFNKRIKSYFFGESFTFDHFLKPSHLNKSVSMSSIENDMVDWLEKIEADILVINSLTNAEAVLAEYYDTKDITTAIRIVNEREERKKQVSNLVNPTKQAAAKTVIIKLHDASDSLAVETFMELKNIKYTIEKG